MIRVSFGTVRLIESHRIEDGKLVCYSSAIYYDRDGIETHRTEPKPISSLGWDGGSPFTEHDARKYGISV